MNLHESIHILLGLPKLNEFCMEHQTYSRSRKQDIGLTLVAFRADVRSVAVKITKKVIIVPIAEQK